MHSLLSQVTDTTTFTDEKRRAEVDAWLYETCTRTLQHIVDIVVQVRPLQRLALCWPRGRTLFPAPLSFLPTVTLRP